MKNPVVSKQAMFFLLAFLSSALVTHSVSPLFAHGTTIRACVKKNNGSLRIIDGKEKCSNSETSLTWNIQGPPGPAGPAGSGGSNGFGEYIDTNLSGYTEGLSDESFVHKNFEGGNFSGSTLGGRSFDKSNMKNTNFTDAILSGIRAVETNFTHANFTNANLSQSDLSTSILTGVVWSNTICPDGTNSDENGDTCVGHLTP